MFRRIRNWWYLRVLGQPVTEAGSVPGSTVTRYPSPLEEGETVYKADPMSMGAQGHAYFQGCLPDMQTKPTMALASNRRVVRIGDTGLVSLSVPWGDITEYWVGDLPFPSNPPETGRGIVLFLATPSQYLPFPKADLVIDPFDIADWLKALQSHGKQPRS